MATVTVMPCGKIKATIRANGKTMIFTGGKAFDIFMDLTQ